MENIIEIHLGHLKNDLHIFAMGFVLDAIQTHKIIADDFPVAYKTLQDVFEREKIAYKRFDRAFLAQELHEAKSERDSSFRALRTYLISISLSQGINSERTIEDAKFLLEYLKELGGSDIIHKPYDATSGILNGIIENFEGKYAEKVERCFHNHYDIIEYLKEGNERFLNAQNLQDKSLAEHGKQEMRRARLMTDRAYRALIYSINIKAYLDKTDAYNPFISYLNEELHALRSQLKTKGVTVEIDEADD